MRMWPDPLPTNRRRSYLTSACLGAWVTFNGSTILASRAVRNEAGDVGMRVCDLAYDYAALLAGRPFDIFLDRFRQHGLGWDDVDPGLLFGTFNPGLTNMYQTQELGNPRLGFFGGANDVWNKGAAESGMPVRGFWSAFSPALANFVVEQIDRVAMTGQPLLQYVRVEDRRNYYYRLLLPATNGGPSSSKVLSFCTPTSLFFPAAMRPPPQASCN